MLWSARLSTIFARFATIFAGEQEGRIVYAIEIEPAYVDVTVTRWEDFTGQKATRKR